MTPSTNANASGDDRGAQRKHSIEGECGTEYSKTRRDRLELLNRLDGLRQTGPDKWRARCPAHGSRGLTLAIKDSGESLLLHCHAGCGAADVLAATGLELADLYDTPIQSGPKPRGERIRIDYRETLRALRRDILIIGIIVSDFSKTGKLDDEEREALANAGQFCLNAAEVAR